jgi:hypothetical protein
MSERFTAPDPVERRAAARRSAQTYDPEIEWVEDPARAEGRE